jgi:hypothetical protein
MKLLKAACCTLLASACLFAQEQPAAGDAADKEKKIADRIEALQAAMAEQQKQIEQLRTELQQQKAAAAKPQLVNASLNTTGTSNTTVNQSDADKPKTSPLSIRIGGTEFTPGGFVDLNNIFRTTNTGSVVSTNWSTIPFSNNANGHLTEFRSSAQYSRWNLKLTGKYGDNDLAGMIEGDFNGNDANNVFVTTNPHTFRLRLYYLQLKRHEWEFTAGQAWSLITPNKVGTSATPGDLDVTMSTDGNIHVGVMYSRDAQFRVGVKPNEHFSWALSVENPQQITTAQVALPSGFTTVLGNQADGTATPGVPNLFPDIMTKLAFDTNPKGHNVHFEAGAMATSAQIAVPQPGSTTAFVKNSAIGGGGFGGINIALTKDFRILAHGLYGPGVGRYHGGFGPQFVVAPIVQGPGAFIAEPSMVHSGAGFGGFEWNANAKTQIGAYYGASYYQRNAFPDVTSTAATKPIIGFGGVNSANSNNKSIQEGSFILAQTLWKNPQYGAVVIINDASYASRAPWFHTAVQPKNAHMFMDHLDLRYVLP